ncbi:MAG: hypothetical protein Q4G23_05735, partial [Clostridia bacterium]|nr:hypothetical protein [Clostridia bacterium]
MNDFEKQVLKIIGENHGVKAKDIADLIGCERRNVNSALYGNLKNLCYQDSSYKWYLNGSENQQQSTESVVEPDKQLADICKYYLNCLSLEENNGISAFLTSNFSLDYAELPSLDVDSTDMDVAKLISKVSNERNLTAHVGYPVSIKKFFSTKTNQEYFKIVPVFLFPVEICGG